MKAHFLRDRRSSIRGARKPEEKGVALVTVLAIVLLMAVLVMSFFEMAKSELNASLKDSDNLKARSFADAAVNIAIAQIREATTQKSTSEEYAPWSSQPGAIRVYQPYGDLKAIYKLYSSTKMLADSMQQLERDDIKKDWDTEPDQWVDMNAPVVIPGIVDEKNTDQSEVFFPIADPRAARAQKQESVEGFSYKDGVNGVVRPSGGRLNSQRLPMPVRWLYMLADGTVGSLSKAGEFVAPVGGGEPTKENPIVGRIAFWTDDETCKINVNTASEGVFWDTPRANTEEDKWLGQSQPVNGEFQRYPGHPAMVCLSSVLFPNKRFRAAKSESANPTGSSIAMKEMDVDEAKAIWRMSPYIYGEEGDRSSFGGRSKPKDMAVPVAGNNSVKTLAGEPNPKHLYNSYDDYLIASLSDAKIGGSSTTIEVKERRPVGDKNIKLPIDRIQQGRFFMTTRSSAPEISLGGLPRVSLWPIDNTVMAELANTKTSNISAGSRFSIYDTLIGFNTSIRKASTVYPYFFQRQDVTSRHQEFYNNSGGRNKVLWDYLTKAFLNNIPGFSLRRADPSGINFKNFADKYGGTRYDDLPAITAQMVDYMRNQNLSDGNLQEGNRYVQTSAYGQVTPVCCCGGSSEHSATWYIASSPSPKGTGRFVTVSEVALVVGLRAKMVGGGSATPVQFNADNRNLVGNPPQPGMDFYEMEVGLLVEAFSVAQGWSEYRPNATFVLGGFSGPGAPSRTYTNSQTGTAERTIGKMEMCGKMLVYEANAATSRAITAQAPPKEWIGWGGTIGVRTTPEIITFKPVLFSIPAGQPLPPFNFSGTISPDPHLRLIVYDTNSGPNAASDVDTGNLIQFIPLAFPSNDGGYPLPKDNPKPFRERMVESRGNGVLFGNNGLIHPGDIVQSLVPNHGDFRLLAAKRAVMQGRSSSAADSSAREFPTFVAHPNYGRKLYPLAHSLREPKPEESLALPTRTVPGVLDDFGYFTKDNNSVDLKLRPEYMPDFPIKPWEDNVQVKLVGGLSLRTLSQGAISGGKEMRMPMREVFNITRYDHLSGTGRSARFKRGAAQPDITGDFDTGVGPALDGPYANHGDDGEVRGASGGGAPYFSNLDATSSSPKTNAAMFAPNRVIPSAGVFGSLSTGVAENVPWQTLLFRPDIELSKPQIDRDRQHYGSRYPRDHLFMDMFWMPVVQPYAISEPFETKGKINMNYQILPFTYITRATALHALFKSEKVMAIPDNRTDDYKIPEKEGGASGPYKMADSRGAAVFRHFIDPEETLQQWEERFAGTDQASTSRNIKPGAFLSASEICDQWLVPQGQTRNSMVQFWQHHRQTGDNVKERPYANLYPRLTARSNAYRVHVIAQSLRKARKSDQRSFQPEMGDQVTAEYRGSYLVERSIDPTDPDLKDYAVTVANLQDYEPLDKFYFYRISQVKQFVR